MMKTRFQKEYDGDLGEFWAKHAREELSKIRKELAEGEITIDANGVAYNCIGRVVVSDVEEMLSYVTDKVNAEATQRARDIENHADAEEYRQMMRNYKPSEEELYEMRAAFGEGTEVVDFITGQRIQL